MKILQTQKIEPHKDLVLAYFKNDVNYEVISGLIGFEKPDFEGNFKEQLLVYGRNSERIYLLGLGEEHDKNRSQEAFKSLAFKNRKKWSKEIQIDCSHLDETMACNAVLGFELASYDIGMFKKDKDENKLRLASFTVQIIFEKEIEKGLKEAQSTANSINRIKSLIDAPANQKTPEYLAEWAKNSSSNYEYSCEVLDKEQLIKEGFGGILAVGQGSVNPPVLIKTMYNPTNSENPSVILVGKGITFDTGGLSIKPSQNLHYMKSDMGGSAVVLGVVELVARLQLPIHIMGLVASAENAVDANSFRPGDVIKSYSGKTIEIIDTDAEGRLVLADALHYATNNYKPDTVIDLATLTGSVVRTLGYSAAGMFTTNDHLSRQLSDIGENIRERVWRLPMYKDFEEDLHSDIADLRNFSNKPVAGGITAAKFLEAFTNEHKNWVHLDIAGAAFGDSEYSKMKSASGYGVRLIIEYLKSLV
ncbi:MAG: leucyl aminopeptidase family protein [Bacteroidota bacterium]